MPTNKTVQPEELVTGIKIFSNNWETPEGGESTNIWLQIEPDGTICLMGQDMGPSVEKFWNHDDYEYKLEIPAESAHRFLALVLKEAFNSEKKLTIGKLNSLCQESGIEVEFSTWP